MSRILEKEIFDFVRALPYWQQLLSAKLLGLIDIEEQAVVKSATAHLLHSKNLILEKPEEIDIIIPDIETGSEVEGHEKFNLSSISDVSNVNALSNGQVFLVAQCGLTVVYGDNGVGKSGYARLFNKAFHSRGDSFILGNVYGPDANEDSDAKFTFLDKEGVSHEFTLASDLDEVAFSQFASFDSKSVIVHLDNQNELHVKPVELEFFPELVTLISKVSEEVDSFRRAHLQDNSTLNFFGNDPKTEVSNFINNLTADSDLKVLETFAEFSEDDVKKNIKSKKELDSLNVSEVQKRKRELNVTKIRLQEVKSRIEELTRVFSVEQLGHYSRAVKKINELRISLKEKGVEQFSDERFKGIGSDTWLNFLKSGEVFNRSQCSLDHVSPNEGDPCPYCRQDISKEAYELINRYRDFLADQSAEEIKKIESWIKSRMPQLKGEEVKPFVTTEKTFEWLMENDSSLGKEVIGYFDSIKKLKLQIVNSLEKMNEKVHEIVKAPTDKWQSLFNKIDIELKSLNEEEVLKRKKVLTEEVLIFSHREIASKQLKKLVSLVENMRWSKSIDKLRKSITRTRAITDKRTELETEHISNRYKQLFKEECIALKIPIPDQGQTGGRGTSKRKYTIVGNAPSKVLSEGEQRAVALADFFTEAEIGDLSGLIFDDPVNSMDYERKVVIAKRIASESKSRQVIVLTHDLVFLNDLVAAAEEIGTTIDCHWMVKHNSQETGVIHANTKPDIDEAFLTTQYSRDLLEKARGESNPKEKIRLSKSGLDALRNTYEIFIVRKIFNGVVRRFSRRVKYFEFPRVHAPKETLQFVENKLGELSGYITGHSQLLQNATEVNPDLLESHIKEFEEFEKNYNKEKKQAFNDFKKA